MNLLEFLAITCNSFKSRVQGVIGFCFASNAIAFNLFRQSFENCSIKQSNLVWEYSIKTMRTKYTTFEVFVLGTLPVPFLLLAFFSLSSSSITWRRLISPNTATSKCTMWRIATWPAKLRNRAKIPGSHVALKLLKRLSLRTVVSSNAVTRIKWNYNDPELL